MFQNQIIFDDEVINTYATALKASKSSRAIYCLNLMNIGVAKDIFHLNKIMWCYKNDVTNLIQFYLKYGTNFKTGEFRFVFDGGNKYPITCHVVENNAEDNRR